MSIQFTCDDKQTLVSYLYGETDHATRQAVEAHLAACAACASEVTSLGDVRSELGLWVPPEVELDFTIVKKSDLLASNVLRPARWWNVVPAWAQAAAAILVIAAGASIANLQVRSGPDGFSVSTGWMGAQAPTLGASDRDAVGVEAWRPALVSLEQQLRNEIRSTREQDTRVVARAPGEDATIRRVQQLIAESEQRHERALAMRFVEFTRDMDRQRRADLVRISQGFGNYEDQLLRQRQMLNNVIRISGTPQQ